MGSVDGLNKKDGQKMWPLGLAIGQNQMSIGQKVCILQSSRAIFSTADYFFLFKFIYINTHANAYISPSHLRKGPIVEPWLSVLELFV